MFIFVRRHSGGCRKHPCRLLRHGRSSKAALPLRTGQKASLPFLLPAVPSNRHIPCPSRFLFSHHPFCPSFHFTNHAHFLCKA